MEGRVRMSRNLVPGGSVSDRGHGVEDFGHHSSVPLSLLPLLFLDRQTHPHTHTQMNRDKSE